MSVVHVSVFFVKTWRKQLITATRKSRSLTLDGIEENVWQPTLDKCTELLEQLYTQEICLSLVDEIFWEYNPAQLTIQLERLAKGVNACRNQTENEDVNWVDQRVQRMQIYWNLCGYRKAAITFLELQKTLNLEKGDFSDVEMLANKVIQNI